MDQLLANLGAVVYQAARMFGQLVPYVLVGALFGAGLRRIRRIPFLDAVHSRNPRLLLVAACGLGTVSPLCTMGTVPFLAGLLGRGIPAGPIIGFLVSSSMVNPQLLVLTVGTVGVPLAMARWLAALAVGVSIGWLAQVGEERGWQVFSAQTARIQPARAGNRPPFLQSYLDHLQFVALHLVAGVLIASMVTVFVPPSLLVRWLGPDNQFAVAASSLLGIPFYVCGGGILPVMKVLMDMGVPAGVILAFFISGPATRIQAIAALSAFLSPRALIVYVFLVLIWALGLGLITNMIFAPV